MTTRDVTGGSVHASGVQHRLRALNRAGWTYRQLNVLLGKNEHSSYARTVATQPADTVPARVAAMVYAIPWPDDGRPTWRWWDNALCRGLPVLLFFPTPGHRPDREALDTCARCPVKDPCLAEAMADHDEVAIRGGTTVEQRARMRRAAK